MPAENPDCDLPSAALEASAVRFMLRSIRQLLLDHEVDPMSLHVGCDGPHGGWTARLRGRVIGRGADPAELRAAVRATLAGTRRWSDPSRLLASWAEAYGE